MCSFMSYIQVTFLVEAMANANFVKRANDFLNGNFCTLHLCMV